MYSLSLIIKINMNILVLCHTACENREFQLSTAFEIFRDRISHVDERFNNIDLYKTPLDYSVRGFTYMKDGLRYKWMNPCYEYVLSLKMNHNLYIK